jgi:diguanylate cyclase (GGDEF)-like protein
MAADGPDPGRRAFLLPRCPSTLPVLLSGGCVAWFLAGLPGQWAPPVIGWAAVAAAALVAAAVAWRTAGAPGLAAPTRRFWRSMAATAGLVAVAVVAQARDALTGPVVPSQRLGAVTVGCYAATVVVVLWAVLRLPGPRSLPAARHRRFWTDTVIVLATTGLYAWYLIDTRRAAWTAVTGSPETLLAVTLLTAVLVVAFAKVTLLGTHTVDRRSLWLLAVAAGGGAAATPMTPLLADHPHLSPAMLTIPVATATLALAARAQLRAAGRPARPTPPTRPYSLLPYAAVGATDVLLVAVVADGGRRAVIVAAVAVALTAVVLYRQIVALTGNARLLRRVDASVRELTDAQRRLAHQAQHDDLTGLPNRRLFERLTREALDGDGGTCVMLIDLDDFKSVNDRLGHVLGDALLVIVARRLAACVRPEDMVARLGGDEFALLLRGIAPADAAAVLDRVAAALDRPIAVEGHNLLVASSIGVAGGAAGIDPTELLRRADLAMYAAKERGKGRHAWYEAELDQRAHDDAQLGAQLRQAVDRGEFHLLYQPVVRLPDGRPVGAEALVRWRHPERGLVPPEQFVGAAERTGLIVPLGDWILHEACRQAAEWLRSTGPDHPWKVSVNISARQLREPDVAGRVAAALAAAELPAARLMVEVTETAVFDNGPAVEALTEISALGVRVALDDFGTGHSSLGLLRTTPVDVLKVDKSFVDGITDGTEEAVIATAMIQIARGLHLGAVAEGVETAAQAQRLCELGYRLAQGFHFARPLRGDEVGALLAAEARRSVPV